MADGVARVLVGAIAGAFGVRGEARVKPFTADPRAIGAYGPLESEDGARRFELRVTRVLDGAVAARIAGVETREAAAALRGLRLYAARTAFPALADDEFYHADLIGLTVVDLGGRRLGRVTAVQNHGAGDLLEIALAPGVASKATSALLPFTREAAPHVDLARRELVADPPAGLLDDEAEETEEPDDEPEPGEPEPRP